jgi:tellurite methyltransferase
MQRKMVGFFQDAEDHWVAELECGHTQHVRHRPPFTLRPWVLTAEGRAGRLGETLDCVLCDREGVRERGQGQEG